MTSLASVSPRLTESSDTLGFVGEEKTTSMALPLDSDGFLRRECPTCEREFKWLAATGDDDATPAPDGGYFCPYCSVQAPPDAWFTPAQLERARATVAHDLVVPELKRFERQGFEVEINAPEPEPLTETDDMRRIDVYCHPEEPVKVLDDWDRPVHCLLCGTPIGGEAPS